MARQIESVRISSERRGAGLGQEMISWAVDKCRERGCQIIQLTSDKAKKDAANFIGRSVLLRPMRDSENNLKSLSCFIQNPEPGYKLQLRPQIT